MLEKVMEWMSDEYSSFGKMQLNDMWGIWLGLFLYFMGFNGFKLVRFFYRVLEKGMVFQEDRRVSQMLIILIQYRSIC